MSHTSKLVRLSFPATSTLVPLLQNIRLLANTLAYYKMSPVKVLW